MSEENKVGIKETKEVVQGCFQLGAIMTKAFKDGFQAGEDLSVIMSALVADPVIKAAYEDASKIPSEIKDLDAEEGIELAMTAIAEIPKILVALK